VHQEFDAHGLSRKGCHVHLLIDPSLATFTLMEDRLQDGAGRIGDIGILPVERNAVSGVIPVVEAQCGLTSWDCELLIE
jgi:hypothetical protein